MIDIRILLTAVVVFFVTWIYGYLTATEQDRIDFDLYKPRKKYYILFYIMFTAFCVGVVSLLWIIWSRG